MAAGYSLICNKPAGLASGDVMVAQYGTCGESNGAADEAASAGWSQFSYGFFGDTSRSIWTKVAGGSEPATYTWVTATRGGRRNVGIVAYRGVSNADPIGAYARQDTVGSTTFPTPAFTTEHGHPISAQTFVQSEVVEVLVSALELNPATATDGELVVMTIMAFATPSFTPPATITRRLEFGDYRQFIGQYGPLPGAAAGWTLGEVRHGADTGW